MSGLCGFRHHPGMRWLPRPGWAGGSPDLVSVPRLPGRRRRAGAGHGRTAARDGSGRGVGSSVPCKVTVRALPGRTAPARACIALRPAVHTSPPPPQGAICGVQPRGMAGAAKRPCRHPADTIPGAPSRGAGKAAAFSRHALQPRRASVVTTTKLGSDDALRRRIDNPETRVVSGFPPTGAEQRKSAGKCRGAKRRFFRVRQKKYNPDVRPCTQGGIGCPVSGARVRFVTRLVGDCPVG